MSLPYAERNAGPGFDKVERADKGLAVIINRPFRRGDLIDRLIAGGTNTRSIAKGTCAAVLGSAVTLVQ